MEDNVKEIVTNVDDHFNWTRKNEFELFVKNIIDNHISYTVNQYGEMNVDDPENGDLMSRTSILQIQSNLLRYVNRMLSGERGEKETIRDLYKIAHYAAIAWGKYIRGEEKIPGKQTKSNKLIFSENDLKNPAVIAIKLKKYMDNDSYSQLKGLVNNA